MKKIVLLAFVLVLLSTAVIVGSVRPVVGEGTIYIRADGSVEGTDRIQQDGTIYTFIGNIEGEIVVQRSNIVIDGDGHILQGVNTGKGLNVSNVDNVTIHNMIIQDFTRGILLEETSYIAITGNTIRRCYGGIKTEYASHISIIENDITAIENFGIIMRNSYGYIDISGNDITNTDVGIITGSTSHPNTVSGNSIAYNRYGIVVSSHNVIVGNNITNNDYGIDAQCDLDSLAKIYHNNFVDNIHHVDTDYAYEVKRAVAIWDNGPSGGNYWDDYTGVDSDGDGIGDTPYVIDENNQDRYPLMSSWDPTWSPKPPEEIPETPPQVEEEVPFWTQWWFRTTVAAVIVILAGAVYFLKKKKPPIPAATPLPGEGTLQNTSKHQATKQPSSLPFF